MGLNEKFVVSFCGNHGVAQGLSSILDAARLLQGEKNIVFCFIGEGPVKADLLRKKETEKIENVILNEVTDFDGIVKKWESFIDSISQERSLIFGPMIKNLKPMNLEGNKLKISGADEDGKYILMRNQDYINKKVIAAFGRKLNLQFSDPSKSPVSETKLSSEASSIKSSVKKESKTNDALIDAIINELGGQEID